MPQTTPDILAAAIKCFHLNSGKLIPEFVVIYSPHAALFAITTLRSHQLRSDSHVASDWQICLNLPPRQQLQLMGIATPTSDDAASDLDPATVATLTSHMNQPPPESNTNQTLTKHHIQLEFDTTAEDNEYASDTQNL